jgi:hypothetical protein
MPCANFQDPRIVPFENRHGNSEPGNIELADYIAVVEFSDGSSGRSIVALQDAP